MAKSKSKLSRRSTPKPKTGARSTGQSDVLERIATALERLAPQRATLPDLRIADAFVWHPDGRLAPVAHVNRVEMSLLKGIDRVRDVLVENTERFAKGLPANNALLWGARGMGKSSLVKATHAGVNAAVARNSKSRPLKLIEIHREDIDSLPALMTLTRGSPHRFILFCDDLSFDAEDTTYKSLKAVLEGGIEGRPDNVIFYATSNRRHLMSRDMMENERSTAINPGETVEEKVSLSDRFGLWLGFHRCSQDEYLAMVDGYVDALQNFGARRSAASRGAGMVDDARLALGPRGLAVCAGSRRTTRCRAEVLTNCSFPRQSGNPEQILRWVPAYAGTNGHARRRRGIGSDRPGSSLFESQNAIAATSHCRFVPRGQLPARA